MKIRISKNKASLSSKINLFLCCIRVEKRDRALDILSGGKTEQYRLTTLSTLRLSPLRHMIRFKNGGHARF